MFTKVHPVTSIDDALTQLDTRVPLLHSELVLIVQSLYDLAFREGARQGRQAGVEAMQNAGREQEDPGLLVDPGLSYRDPTTIIRERLAATERARNGKS